jgi:glutathione peroxidase
MKIAIILAILFSSFAIYIAVGNQNSKHMTFRQKILKAFYPVIMKMTKSDHKSNGISNDKNPIVDIYGYSITLNDGSTYALSNAKGKKLVLVNTASDCGFTGQYEALEKLFQQEKNNLVMIGFPSNDFGNQEKQGDAQIAQFCKLNYGVSFLLAKKGVVIKDKQQLEIYRWLSDNALNGWNDTAPSWNFCKYVIDENGKLTHFFNSSIDPMSQTFLQALKK